MTPKVIKAYPPLWNEIAKVFPVKGRQGIVYAWGDVIYNPSGIQLSQEVLDHEAVHCTRQLSGITIRHGHENPTEAWWDQYMRDPLFRLDEEVLAHRAEYASFRSRHNASMTHSYLGLMADRLSSRLYGHLISHADAIREIQKEEVS